MRGIMELWNGGSDKINYPATFTHMLNLQFAFVIYLRSRADSPANRIALGG